MHGFAKWVVSPFGSLRMFLAATSVLFFTQLFDILSTFVGLSRSGFDFNLEMNPLARAFFFLIGFWPSAILGLTFGTAASLFLCIALYWCFILTYPGCKVRIVRNGFLAVWVSVSIVSVKAAIYNLFPELYTVGWPNRHLVFGYLFYGGDLFLFLFSTSSIFFSLTLLGDRAKKQRVLFANK